MLADMRHGFRNRLASTDWRLRQMAQRTQAERIDQYRPEQSRKGLDKIQCGNIPEEAVRKYGKLRGKSEGQESNDDGGQKQDPFLHRHDGKGSLSDRKRVSLNHKYRKTTKRMGS